MTAAAATKQSNAELWAGASTSVNSINNALFID